MLISTHPSMVIWFLPVFGYCKYITMDKENIHAQVLIQTHAFIFLGKHLEVELPVI